MPLISAQHVEIFDANHARVELTTPLGYFEVDVLQTTGPRQVTITAFRNSVQIDQVVLNNPPAAQVEAQIEATATAMLNAAGPNGAPWIVLKTKLVSVSPLGVGVLTLDPGAALPPGW